MDELRASGRISRGPGAVDPLRPSESAETGIDLDGLAIDNGSGGVWTLDEMLHCTYTDAFLVLHRGRVVAERYFNGMCRSTRHGMFSMTKTVTGVLALLAVEDGAMGLDDPVVDHVPELADTAYAPTTIRHLLDMTDGIRFVEDYADNRSDIHRYAVAMAFTPVPENWDGPDGIHEAILGFQACSEVPGEVFLYKSVTTDVLSLIHI